MMVSHVPDSRPRDGGCALVRTEKNGARPGGRTMKPNHGACTPQPGSRHPGGRPGGPAGPVPAGRVARLRRRPGQQQVLAGRRHHPAERPAARHRLAVGARREAAGGVRHGAVPVREPAADGRRRALRHDALQQRGGARRRDRQGAVAVRQRGREARRHSRHRLQASRAGALARRQGRQQAARAAQHAQPAVQPRRADRQAGRVVRQQRRGLADRRAIRGRSPTSGTSTTAPRRRSSTATSSSSAARFPIDTR